MNALAAERAVDFAHLLQEAHFADGQDINLPATYDAICAAHGLPRLDTDAIVDARETTPLVKASFERSRQLGIQSFPTCLVVNSDDDVVGEIQAIYDPQDFVAAFAQFKRNPNG